MQQEQSFLSLKKTLKEMDSLELKHENDEQSVVNKKSQGTIISNSVTMNKSIIQVDIDDCVRLRNGKTGIVKYIEDKTVMGILMNEWSDTNSNGTIDGKRYFEAKDGYGYFAHPSEIIENLSVKAKDNHGMVNDFKKCRYGAYVVHCNLPKEIYDNAKRLDDIEADTGNDHERINPNDDDAALISCKCGDRIRVAGKYTGIVKFIGCVHFNDSQMIGIELDNKCKSFGHDGTMDGREYYQCKKCRGMFVHPQDVTENLGTNNVHIENNSLENKDCSNGNDHDDGDDHEHDGWDCMYISHDESEDELQLDMFNPATTWVHLDDRFKHTSKARFKFGRYKYGVSLASIAHFNLPQQLYDDAKRLDDDQDNKIQ